MDKIEDNLAAYAKACQNLKRVPIIEAVENKVLVVVDEVEEITKGGIILPDSVRQDKQMFTGVVIQVGTEQTNGKPQQVQVGDKVVLGKFAGQDITVRGLKIKMVRHGDIYLIYERAAAGQQNPLETVYKHTPVQRV